MAIRTRRFRTSRSLDPVGTGSFEQVCRRRRCESRAKEFCRRSAFSLAVSVRESTQGDAPLPLRGSVRFPQGDSSKLYRQIAGRDQLEVGPLARGVTFKPLSGRLQPSVRFLHHPLPAPPSASLAIGLPTTWAEIRAYPVPYRQHEQVRSCLSTGGAVSTCLTSERDSRPRTILVGAYSVASARL